MPPPIWKKPIDVVAACFLVPLRQRHHVLDAAANRLRRLDSTVQAVRGKHIPERRILPARNEDRQVCLGGRKQPAVFRIDFKERLENPRPQHLVEKFVREEPLAFLVRRGPMLEHDPLDAPHRLFFGNAGVGHAIHVPVEKRLLVGRRQIAIVRHALVMECATRLKTSSSRFAPVQQMAWTFFARIISAIEMPQFGRAHGAGDREEHLSSALQVPAVALGGVLECGGVEMQEMAIDEARNRACRHRV